MNHAWDGKLAMKTTVEHAFRANPATKGCLIGFLGEGNASEVLFARFLSGEALPVHEKSPRIAPRASKVL